MKKETTSIIGMKFMILMEINKKLKSGINYIKDMKYLILMAI